MAGDLSEHAGARLCRAEDFRRERGHVHGGGGGRHAQTGRGGKRVGRRPLPDLGVLMYV